MPSAHFTRFFKSARVILSVYLLTATLQVSGQVLQDAKRVIFPEDIPILFDLIEDSTLKRFTPGLPDIDSADAILKQHFLTFNAEGEKSIDPVNYYRQYAGFWIDGKKFIFLNASCRQTDYFMKNTYYPRGGGQCYFRTLINLYDKKINSFYFNAPK